MIEKAGENATQWTFSSADTEGFIPREYKRKSPTNLGKCKLCDGKVMDKGKIYGCTNYSRTKCPFMISKKIAGKSITQKMAKQLLKDGTTDLIEGFSGKERSFSAKLNWDKAEQKVKFLFENAVKEQR